MQVSKGFPLSYKGVVRGKSKHLNLKLDGTVVHTTMIELI